MNSRFLSVIKSFEKNGLSATIGILLKVLMVKLGILNYVHLAKRGKIYLRNHTSDIPVFRQIFLDKEYDFNLGIEDPKLIIDVGANIGLFTKVMKRRFPTAHFICLEPEPANFIQLEKNLTLESNITLLEKALWTDNLGVHIEVNAKYGEWGATVRKSNQNEGKIESITMDEVIQQFQIQKIDILKIDIEGAEKYIFDAPNIEWLKKVKVLIIELHDFMSESSSNPFFKAIAKMAPYNFATSGENIIITSTIL